MTSSVLRNQKMDNKYCPDLCNGKCTLKPFQCKFTHCDCKFGIECNKETCCFGHPVDWDIRCKVIDIVKNNKLPIARTKYTVYCKYGLTCNNKDCVYAHKVGYKHRQEIKQLVNDYITSVRGGRKTMSDMSDATTRSNNNPVKDEDINLPLLPIVIQTVNCACQTDDIPGLPPLSEILAAA